MIQELDRTDFFKGVKSDPAEDTEKDMLVVRDMLDTMRYYYESNKKDYMLGEVYSFMTANMIGVNKRIMIVRDMYNGWGCDCDIIINPVVIDLSEFMTEYQIEKERKSILYPEMSSIALEYYDERWEKKRKLFDSMYGDIKRLLDRLDGIF